MTGEALAQGLVEGTINACVAAGMTKEQIADELWNTALAALAACHGYEGLARRL